MKKMLMFVLLLAFAVTMLNAQVNIIGGEGEDGPRLEFSGQVIGMFSLGFADDEQLVIPNPAGAPIESEPVGIFDGINQGRNGYLTRVDFSMRFLPVSWVELYVRFTARSRPGTPYVPLMLEAASMETFAVAMDQGWGRVNAIDGLGLNLPLDLFLKAGKFDTGPESFHLVTGFGTENVLSRIRTKNVPALSLEAVLNELTFVDSLHFVAATSHMLNDAILPLFDVDGSMGSHGQWADTEDHRLPLFAAVQARGITTPFGPVSAEIVYGLNAEEIYSGHNFGFGGRWDIQVPSLGNMEIPLGLSVALLEKNIDPMARAAHGFDFRGGLWHIPPALGVVGGAANYNWSTVSFRRSLRAGIGAGLRWNPIEELRTEANLGFSYSQIAHIYRDTLTLNSASFDLRVTWGDRFFVGGGIFLGTLMDAEWRTSSDLEDGSDIDPGSVPGTAFSHTFTLAENMGFEVYAGLQFARSRFVVGYNLNRGLSMNHGIETMTDSQIVYRQRGSAPADNLFETGGFFTKLVIQW